MISYEELLINVFTNSLSSMSSHFISIWYPSGWSQGLCQLTLNLKTVFWFFLKWILSIGFAGTIVFFFLIYFIYLFILAALGLLIYLIYLFCCAGFLYLRRAGATLRCGAWASHCGGFSCCGAWSLGAWVSVVVARRLSSCGAPA